MLEMIFYTSYKMKMFKNNIISLNEFLLYRICMNSKKI